MNLKDFNRATYAGIVVIREKMTMKSKKKYRPLPFWSWNDKLEKRKLIDQIHWMNENGMGGFFMHARSGLMTEYLSEDWMQCIEVCADEAEMLGMKAWIYDENGWPSGFVGGKLLEDEKNCDKYILTKEGVFDEHATLSYLLTEDELVRVSGNEMSAKAETQAELQGVYLNLYIHTSVSTADILNPDVVKQFLTLTHQAYKERFGDKFSKKIEGFFTDEPQYYRNATPYTDMVAKYWQKQYGEDILDSLGLLFVEKKGYRSFRYRYWKAMQSLMVNNFAKQVYDWCNKNGVKLTGHYVGGGSLIYQMVTCAGIMPLYEYEHIPGIDWLAKRTDAALSARQVCSVAAQLGKKQTLTESFGCCGWDVKPSELKRILGIQYANGINMLCHHLIPYTERGTRKYDHPAHYSNVNPWVKEDFASFNNYYAELGYLLGEGKQSVNVAVLHPIRSVYFDYKREADYAFGVAKWEVDLFDTIGTLAKHGVEYHFIDETLFEKYGFVEGQKLGCGKCTYDYLILPSMITMDVSTEKLLRQYVEQGGKVLIFGDKPQFLEAEPYNYDYLESNVTFDEIMQAQKYQVTNFDTKCYSTYRLFEDKEYLYVTNSSDRETYSQSYIFEGKQFDVTLKPGEDKLICLSEEPASQATSLVPYVLRFAHAEVTVKENYLLVDMVRYSMDGECYSELWPVMALFEKLIREKYQGQIFFQYEFEIDELPTEICLRAEKSNDVAAWFNDVQLTVCVQSQQDYIHSYDISSMVKKGMNTYTVQVDWCEDEMVNYVLFGENVNESLRNCIVYDTELQPIELVGKFGVYSRKEYQPDEDERFVGGENFYIGAMPTVVEAEPVIEGFPFLAGDMTLKTYVVFDTSDILLQLDGEYQMAFVKVNGEEAGKLLFDTELDISNYAKHGKNEIEIRFVLSNRNLMGPHHLEGPKDRYIDPNCFQLFGDWKERESERYHSFYDLRKFYV